MRVLIVNPVIHDFAAYDFWAKPLGAFTLAAILERSGVDVDFLDLTDPLSPFLPGSKRPPRKRFGHGRFVREPIQQPDILPNIRRRFSRYGLPEEAARAALGGLQKPDAVLVTSMMTYWYGGVAETIGWIRGQWPEVPVGLGGVYATLCQEHAHEHMDADRVFPGPAEMFIDELGQWLGIDLATSKEGEFAPAYNCLSHADSAPLLTSRGCPFQCVYCGVHALYPGFITCSPEEVARRVRTLVHGLGIRDIALYDDAFLADRDRALEILDRISNVAPSVRLHAASGMGCRGLTRDVAKAMKRAGFATVRLEFETADPEIQRTAGGKVTTKEFHQAVDNLLAAGMEERQIGAYVIAGLPHQEFCEVEQAVREVMSRGIAAHLSEFSPVPGSPLFPLAQEVSRFDLREPLFHNPTLLPCAGDEVNQESLQEIRMMIKSGH